MLKSVLLSLLSVDASLTPFTVILLYLGDRPLITTLFPSPPSLLIETPGTRATVSAALASGSSCILSDEIILTKDLEFNCLFMASICPFA